MSPRTLRQISSTTRTFHGRTTSATSQSTSYERYVFVSSIIDTNLLTFSQSVLTSISRVRFENGKTPPVIRQFLVDQLRFNDNTLNPVSLVCVVTSIAVLTTAIVCGCILHMQCHLSVGLLPGLYSPSRARRVYFERLWSSPRPTGYGATEGSDF